ncbi:MAG: hypothetical protein ACK55I_30575, partial [bacterium]
FNLTFYVKRCHPALGCLAECGLHGGHCRGLVGAEGGQLWGGALPRGIRLVPLPAREVHQVTYSTSHSRPSGCTMGCTCNLP